MSILDWGLKPREINHVRAVLQEDEQVLLVLRPETPMNPMLRWHALSIVAVVLLITFCPPSAGGFYHEIEYWQTFPVALVICIPSACFLFSRWRKSHARCHAFYLLTSKRAIVMEATPLGFRPCVFPLQWELVETVAVRGDGSGNIVFAERKDWYIDKRVRDEVQQIGFMDIPQVKHVQQVLEQAIEACTKCKKPRGW